MMKNIDRAWTEADFFGWFWRRDGHTREDNIWAWNIFGTILGGAGLGVALFIFMPWLIATVALVTFLVGWNVAPWLGKLSPMLQIDDNKLRPSGEVYDGYSYYYENNEHASSSRDLLYDILALPKEDQRLFPHDLVEVLSKDLTPTARYEINSELEKTLEDIKTRNAHRKELEQKAIVHEGVVAALEATRENLKAEIDTYKELA